jgi:uncharacterized protein (TIGR00290 family)
MADKKVICLWSGGKDSCFAVYEAKKKGLDIRYLLNFTKGKNSLSHNIDSYLINSQMSMTGYPFIQQDLDGLSYEESFSQVINKVKREGIEAVVFGDIYLEEHRRWLERVCEKNKIQPIFPLWGRSTDKIIDDFIEEGFKAMVVAVRKNILDRYYLGRITDRAFVDELKKEKPDIDLCGESGEFHTFVLSGPLFSSEINILSTEESADDTYYLLKILEYEIPETQKS